MPNNHTEPTPGRSCWRILLESLDYKKEETCDWCSFWSTSEWFHLLDLEGRVTLRVPLTYKLLITGYQPGYRMEILVKAWCIWSQHTIHDLYKTSGPWLSWLVQGYRKSVTHSQNIYWVIYSFLQNRESGIFFQLSFPVTIIGPSKLLP